MHRPIGGQRYGHLPIAPYELAMGQKFEKSGTGEVQTLWNPYLWNR